MFKSFWILIKSLGIAIDRNTWGLVRRCADNANQDKSDELDKRTAGRIVTYALLILFTYLAPQYVIMLSILRSLVLMDIIGIIGSVCIDAASIFTSLAKEMTCKSSRTSIALLPLTAAT